MSDANNLDKRTLTIEKVFNAPVQVVWDAWTQAEHIGKWWGPPAMPLEVVEHDFRVGGNWKYTMSMPDGGTFVSEGAYKEIIEGEKIVTSANFRPMTEGVELVVLFREEGDKTHFTFHCIHPTEAYCKQQEKMGFYNGWGSAFKRLEEFVADLV